MTDKKLKVLIVDDDKFLLEMYGVKFLNSGFDADTSVGAVNALKKLRDGYKPDIIVSDIVMPEIDGHMFVDTVKKENLAPGAVIVMLTNQSQDSDIDRSRELEVSGYIVKASTIPSEVVVKVKDIYEASKKK